MFLEIGRKNDCLVKPLSATNNSVASRMDATNHVGHNSSAHVARSGHSRTDAILHN